MPVPQASESREISVGRDQLATMLDGERRVIGIRDELAASACLPAEACKELPAGWAMRQKARVRAPSQALDEFEGVFGARRLIPDLWIRHDANEPARPQLGEPERPRPNRESLQPL